MYAKYDRPGTWNCQVEHATIFSSPSLTPDQHISFITQVFFVFFSVLFCQSAIDHIAVISNIFPQDVLRFSWLYRWFVTPHLKPLEKEKSTEVGQVSVVYQTFTEIVPFFLKDSI